MMFYREIAPTAEKAHLIMSFWEFRVESDSPAPLPHEVFPDGCVSILYYRNDIFQVKKFFVSGLSLESIKTQVFGGDVFWGMRISPAACARLLRVNPTEIKSQPLDKINDYSHLTQNLLEKLNDCENFAEAVTVYENLLKTQNLRPTDFDEKVIEAVRIIRENKGEIKIAALAKEVNLSVRQLERRFKQSSGLTPKQFARARRIRATAESLVEESSINWANRAAEIGFTDQAHLSREFVSVTGSSPSSFAARVKKIEHGNLIK